MPVRPLAAAALLVAPLAAVPLAAPATASTPPAAEDVAGRPGRHNAVTDVPGVHVGQVQSTTAPYLTGTTVVHFPRMSVAGVDQRGGAPATKETDLLSPLNSNPGVNAIQLGGSSMYGLAASDGIVRWLEDRGEGVPLGVGVAPIVPAADIYDLARGGDIKARTTPEWGYLAAQASGPGPVRQGVVGGGTGARGGGLKSGLGTASVYLGDGVYVGAIVVVNPAGNPVDPADCSLWGVRYGLGDEFEGYRAPRAAECPQPAAAAAPAADEALNTTIAVVVTNAPLEKAAAARLSGNAHDGMARAIDPIHTLGDGDTVFGVSTAQGATSITEPLQVNDPADGRQLNAIFNAGARTLSRAIAKAVLSAESVGTQQSYCDRYPSACRRMPQLEEWRTAGTAPDVTPRAWRQARRALEVLPVPSPSAPTAAAPAAAGAPAGTPDESGAAPAAGGGSGLPPAAAGAAGALGVLAAAALAAGGGLLLRRRLTVARP
ncbi:P1 family peptidase [Vallicoccus soli]|uniref:Peptidase S58 family protein n=1 Tax=Vallicoccus soli TaxID=2339232 RepID=A0A3A3YXR8_9ACTN|nr:P1 family peptidase [Vallicoccus soli]RJK96448.1 peptidase S58 family protein [Vallicoccus soli]